MKIIKLTLIALITIALFMYIKSDESFNIIKGLPFADGEEINLYHWAALVILLLTAWGFHRLKNRE